MTTVARKSGAVLYDEKTSTISAYVATRRPCDTRTESKAGKALSRSDHGIDAGRRADSRQADEGARQPGSNRRLESSCRQRLVRGPSFRNGEPLPKSMRKVSKIVTI
jgi:hypothetical protein